MRLFPSLLLVAPVLGAVAFASPDASACGGCFVPEDENTLVTGHRMILSVSKTETTLWDQIVYSGDPSSFAWVLPTKGIVEVGLSSDAVFAYLGDWSRVTVAPPPLGCSPAPHCGEGTSFSASGAGGGGGNSAGGVTVVAQEVVGPYETVQLASTDPGALKTWLLDHGYGIPLEVAPVVDAYVNEGFNFLALKLVPGEGIDSMRPVRITSPGAAPVLPLRMVAAGTGALTPITLYMLAEGRYEPVNFPSFTVDASEIVWDWDTATSDYAERKEAKFAATGGFGWMTESAKPMSPNLLSSTLWQVVEQIPDRSGYGDADGTGAGAELEADLEKLVGSIDPSSLWLTRLHARLPREALGKDLQLGAAADQSEADTYLQCTLTTGKKPTCPVYQPCDVFAGSGGSFGSGGSGGASADPGGGCAIGAGTTGSATALGLAGLAGLALLRRRRHRRTR